MVQNWALWRDAGDWERFRTVWHDDGWMTATWFQGPAAEFIKVSKAGFEKGVSILHFLGGSSVDVKGSRAVAQTKMTISQRGDVRRRDGRRGVHRPLLRFLREARWTTGASCAASRSTRRTAWTRSIPSAQLKLDPDLLGSFPEGYRHLAYLQTKLGFQIKRDLPQLKGAEVEQLYRHGRPGSTARRRRFPMER